MTKSQEICIYFHHIQRRTTDRMHSGTRTLHLSSKRQVVSSKFCFFTIIPHKTNIYELYIEFHMKIRIKNILNLSLPVYTGTMVHDQSARACALPVPTTYSIGDHSTILRKSDPWRTRTPDPHGTSMTLDHLAPLGRFYALHLTVNFVLYI